ncbi:4Fe-4S dicluster domain-containing protein [Pseudohongiella sp.]|uniref:4Fe-4S ferredoxin-type domain-containing protein n=1 Tax=marine sediment metagenome TaxID=412755 RepID=A0A0F9Z0Z0_9ZZZZ|nr:4Fe-4S dicluster domain-containing protein [Pseudohongiella sp.]HDZ09959.1 4Fe-4S dicluster domain-containing protein [Pseudohongiella sp.]HEA63737.1 4Fe-4S dicluster domain-containing protein [Pseudohongiella sp.]
MSNPVRDCIRCDFCAAVCPEQLQPQQLYAFSRFQQHEQAKQFDLLQCSECGACETVCPSHLPLLDLFRAEKTALHAQEQADAEATHWQQRFQRHQARNQHEAIAQQERKLQKLQAKGNDLAAGKAISRPVQQADPDTTPVNAKTPEQIQAEIAAAVARTRARKAALQKQNESPEKKS